MTILLGYATTALLIGGPTSITTTGGTTQATGSTFIAAVYSGEGFIATPTSVTDNKSNTYQQANTYVFNSSGACLSLYYCINGAGGSGHTCTASWASSIDAVLSFAEFENVGSGSLDLAPSGTGGASPVTSQTGPSILTSVASELIINAFSTDNFNTQTITDSGSGFAIATSQPTNSNANGALTWAVQVSIGTYADTINVTTSNQIGALALSIIPGSIVNALPMYWVN